MADVNDAGSRSLAGYLYQLVGSANRAIEVLSPPVADASSVSITFAIEEDGQDAVVVRQSTKMKSKEFVQYKFSSNPDKYPLHPSELKNIADAFFESEKAAKQSGATGHFCVW